LPNYGGAHGSNVKFIYLFLFFFPPFCSEFGLSSVKKSSEISWAKINEEDCKIGKKNLVIFSLEAISIVYLCT